MKNKFQHFSINIVNKDVSNESLVFVYFIQFSSEICVYL
ncbi:Uncharacterised protein [Chryseobacterium carnipullorum]|uniref:Uncharacterized protein n=1 Tax=Chryseobacterium carnipullorum TaxID=1124835 RepID=A0A376E2I9_CHRCU|nr:Uncharacterised protein [Chryseobacterium carnipullorum]